jgi:hypothetical protein
VCAQRGEQGVAGFVDGDGVALLGQQGVGGFAAAKQDAVAGGVEVVGGDDGAVVADGVDGGLVDEVGQVGAGKAGCASGDDPEVGVGFQVLAVGVHGQDRRAFGLIGQRYGDLPVEPARAQQGPVEGVGAVGGGQHDDAAGLVEAVHFGEELVEGLLAFLVCAGDRAGAPAADRVDLVDEDDRRCAFAGVVEQVPDAGRAHPDEHLHELRAGHRQERHLRLPGHGPGDQRLAGAGRPDHDHSARAGGAGGGVAGRVAQEVHDFTDLLLDPVVAGDVGEAGLGSLRLDDPCL